MLCAVAIDDTNARIELQHAAALEARRAYAVVRPAGLPRLRSAQIVPAGKSTAGWFGWQRLIDIAQRRGEFPQPDSIKCAKVKMLKPTT